MRTIARCLLDSAQREIQLPKEKTAYPSGSDQLVKNKKKIKIKKKKALSDLGKLTAAYHKGYKTRMYATVQRVKELAFYTRLSEEFHSNLTWWHTFWLVEMV